MKTRPLMTVVLGLVFSAATAGSAWAQLPNPYGPAISVETARKVAAAATAEGKKNGWTIAVAIVDPDGELVLFERMDNTQSASVTVAQEKARSAARFKRPTKAFEDALVGGRQAILALPGAIPLEGGIPLVIDGKIVGAIGVSGMTSQQDGVCAQAAADTLGKAPAAPPHAKAPPPAAPPKK
ncbi:MAG TPA: heme-binding protein [Kofleriaceae bacterium]|nr:heme-binding protein [Kofleriaceae bacterium]